MYEGENCLEGEGVAVKVFRRHQQYQGALQRELFFLKSLAATGAPLGNAAVPSCLPISVYLVLG